MCHPILDAMYSQVGEGVEPQTIIASLGLYIKIGILASLFTVATLISVALSLLDAPSFMLKNKKKNVLMKKRGKGGKI